MAAGTWIYERGSKTGSGGGGGPAVIPDAPNVHIDSATAVEISDGSFKIDVVWHKDASATATNFRGAAVYLEDPHISSLAQSALDGSQVVGDGTTPVSQVSGTWQPVREDDTITSPAVVTVPGEDQARSVRIYLAAFGQSANQHLVRANDTSGATVTPNIVVAIPAQAPLYASGEEYAWVVTGAAVVQNDNFDDPAGP